MQIKLQNQNFSLKILTPLFLVVCYWFYLSICFGYFLSKFFFNFFDEINKTHLSKSIQFRKKFNLENIKKFVISYIFKFFENWIKRIRDKFLFLIAAINKVIRALKICRKKFKSILKFKHNFRLLKNLLPIFWETFLIFCSFMNEIFFLHNIIKWIIQWMNFIRLLMKESLFITRIVYFLYWILLGIFGIIIGFLLGIYKREDEIHAFLLLLLLKIIEQIDPRPLKIIFKEPEQIPLPFFIIEDPLVFIETEVLWEEPINYKFQLFQFYQNVSEKVKH